MNKITDTAKLLTTKEEFVSYTNGDYACIVLDCTGAEDEFYQCYRTEDCVVAKQVNKFSDRGYVRLMQEAIMYRDALNDGKNRIVFHSEVCGLKREFTTADALVRAKKANLPMVAEGDSLVIIARYRMGDSDRVAAFVAQVKGVDHNGDLQLCGKDDVEIATLIFNVIDAGKIIGKEVA